MTAPTPATRMHEPDQLELFIPISNEPGSRPIIRQMKPDAVYKRGVTKATIINMLALHPMTLGALVDKLKRERKTIHGQLTRLVRSGAVLKIARGFYALGKGSMAELDKAAHLDPDHTRTNAFVVLSA